MKLLADESVERLVIAGLRAAGHDVTAVVEDRPGLADPEVLALAQRDDRVLVTNDKDFAGLAFLRREVSAGILLVRLCRSRSEEKAFHVVNAVARDEAALHGAMTVIQPAAIRRRRLP